MIEELKQKLGDEVEKLTHELNVVLPNEIRTAVEQRDRRENSDYPAALERQIPSDRVGLGSRVTVECQDTSTKESYFIVFGDSDNFDEGHVTLASPIGRALMGKAVGDNVLLKLPAKTRKLRILELKTIHEGA